MALEFDPSGPKCFKLATFYRLCGHVETSYLHTSLCKTAIREGLNSGHAGLPFCWCPYPFGKHLAYCVGKCQRCQQTEEPGVNRIQEPHRKVQRGNQVTVTRQKYRQDRIRELAFKWRFDVEEQERISRTERLNRVRIVDHKRQAREMEWNNAWRRHQSQTREDYPAPSMQGQTTSAEINAFMRHRRAKILDLTDDFSRPRTFDDLLERAPDVKPDEDCLCGYNCSEPGMLSDDDEKNILVRFQGGCGHVFHHKCIITALTSQLPQCPFCRAFQRFVLKNGFEEPKFRWILEKPRDNVAGQTAENRLWKVAGYIPFQEGLNGNEGDINSFKIYEKEDRWGAMDGF